MIENVNFILIPHPIPELANHPVPLIGVLLLAAVVAIVDPLEGEVELEVVGDRRDEVDSVPDQNLELHVRSKSYHSPLKRFVTHQLLSRFRKHCIRRRLQMSKHKNKLAKLGDAIASHLKLSLTD